MKTDFCNCKGWVIILLTSEQGFAIKKGEYESKEIKSLLGIPEIETLFQLVEGCTPIKYKDCDKVTIKGCETFYGCVPGAGNSKNHSENESSCKLLEESFGITPKLIKEAGITHFVLENLALPNGNNVDVCLEWPNRNRLLLSEKVNTVEKRNWPPNYANIRIAGKNWHGVSLQTKVKTPHEVFVSYLEALA